LFALVFKEAWDLYSKVSFFKPIFVCLSVVKPAKTGCWWRTPWTKPVQSLLCW